MFVSFVGVCRLSGVGLQLMAMNEANPISAGIEVQSPTRGSLPSILDGHQVRAAAAKF